MKIFNPIFDTPPFETWIYLDLGEIKTFGRILNCSPNDEDLKSEYESFKSGDDEFSEYQFYIQDMTTMFDHSLEYFEGGFCESECLNWFTDSIEAWAYMTY
jgi:hypothetical protein